VGSSKVKTEFNDAPPARRGKGQTANSRYRFVAILCFCLGSAFAIPAVWLCVRGSLPPIPIGNSDTVLLPIESVTINGVPVGKWAFGSTVGGLFVTAFALYFAGWRAAKPKLGNHENAE
jgi:hypothetical protein